MVRVRLLFVPLILFILLNSCSNECIRLCKKEGALFDKCLGEWGSSWEEFGFEGEEDYVENYCIPFIEGDMEEGGEDRIIEDCATYLRLLNEIEDCDELRDLNW